MAKSKNSKGRRPTHVAKISEKKTPRQSTIGPKSTDNEFIVWGITKIDNECKWAWCDVDKDTFWGIILPRLAAFESMTWREAFGDANHAIPIFKLEADARKRLSELQFDDQDRLYRLSVKGAPRIWGVRQGAKFCVLWYDPDHSVYKTKKNR